MAGHMAVSETEHETEKRRTCKLHRLRTLHLFAGAGGGILGDLLLGHQPVCAVEINGYCQQVLAARQQDGQIPWFPVFADVTQFDGTPWRGVVDIVAGGFPCQDISVAGRGAGIDGERSGLWSEMARIIREVRPEYAFVENTPALTGRGLYRVLGDLAEMGFDAEWGVLGARDCGAPHRRDRLWILAHADSVSMQRMEQESESSWHKRSTGLHSGAGGIREWHDWPAEPSVGRVAHGVAHRMDRLRALGNGQVPRVVAAAWRRLALHYEE